MNFLNGPRMELEAMRKEFEDLSEEEKTTAHRDLYGKRQPASSLPPAEEQQIRLQRMREEVEAIPNGSKQAWLMAVERCPEHATSESFQKKFLETDDFDAKKAANRLIRFWQEKLRLFGEEYCFQSTIPVEALNDTELHIIRRGGALPLPRRDKGGRSVFFMNRGLLAKNPNDSDKNMRVLLFCLYPMMMENELCQRQGFVWIVVTDSNFRWQDFNRTFTKRVRRLISDLLPLKVAGIHHVSYHHDMLQHVWPILWFVLGKDWRLRYRLHQESPIAENLENLETFGLRAETLPRELGGSLDTAATIYQFLGNLA